MRRVYLVLILVLSATDLKAETVRITCDHFRGTRVQFFDNPLAPKEQNRKVVIEDDAITGAKLEITYTTSGSDVVMVETGNVNVGGDVKSSPLKKLESNDLVVFMGVDPADGKVHLLSYHPQLKKLLWSSHNDRIWIIDRGVLGKTFIADCR